MNTVTKRTAPLYTKEISGMMAGVAIVLMMTQHLFPWPEWLSEGVSWHSPLGDFGKKLTLLISYFGGVSVNLFAITSGYVLIANPKAYATVKSRLRRLFHFLIGYWMVEALFLLIGALNGDTMPTLKQLACNMVGLSTGPLHPWVNVPFAWYVAYYIEFIILVPVLLWLYKGRTISKDITVTIIMVLISCMARGTLHIPHLHYLVCDAVSALWALMSSCFGILIAKYSLFEKAHDKIGKKIPVWRLLIYSFIIFVCHYYLPLLHKNGEAILGIISLILDAIIATILMYFILEMLIRIKWNPLKQTLLVLGKYSMYLWFLHGIFFTGKHFLQPQLYSLTDPILILAACIISLLPVAYLTHHLVSLLFSLPKTPFLKIC
jgi:peptidoglycan/LPS O-acetylase OafA/YrhL